MVMAERLPTGAFLLAAARMADAGIYEYVPSSPHGVSSGT
jgi:hypothetical protein